MFDFPIKRPVIVACVHGEVCVCVCLAMVVVAVVSEVVFQSNYNAFGQ